MIIDPIVDDVGWEEGTWLEQLLDHLHGRKASSRKFRLLAIAGCRVIWDQLPGDECRAALEAAEQWVDGVVNQKVLLVARRRAEGVAQRQSELARELEYERGSITWAQRARGYEAAMATVEAAKPRVDRVGKALWYAGAATGEQRSASRTGQTALLRDIFGNPFRPVTFATEWRTDTAVALARQMYDARDFSAMPILADALQDAGCDNADILTHCRDPQQVHVRGCWVVDLVLGLS